MESMHSNGHHLPGQKQSKKASKSNLNEHAQSNDEEEPSEFPSNHAPSRLLSSSSTTAASASNGKSTHGGKSAHRTSKKTKGRVKINMEFIENKSRRYTTFSKRKTGIMKKAFELSTLTGTQVMLLVASETGHVYTFATEKLQPMITSEDGKRLIQNCLSDGQDASANPAANGDESWGRSGRANANDRISIENYSNEELLYGDDDDYEDEDEDEEDEDEEEYAEEEEIDSYEKPTLQNTNQLQYNRQRYSQHSTYADENFINVNTNINHKNVNHDGTLHQKDERAILMIGDGANNKASNSGSFNTNRNISMHTISINNDENQFNLANFQNNPSEYVVNNNPNTTNINNNKKVRFYFLSSDEKSSFCFYFKPFILTLKNYFTLLFI
jgi:hypothetical protein